MTYLVPKIGSPFRNPFKKHKPKDDPNGGPRTTAEAVNNLQSATDAWIKAGLIPDPTSSLPFSGIDPNQAPDIWLDPQGRTPTYYDVAEGRVAGAAGSLFDQLAALLPAAPDHASYMAPYDQAEQAARAAHDANVPSINSSYDALRGRTDQRMADYVAAAQAAQAQQQAGSRQAQASMAQTHGANLQALQDQFGANMPPSVLAQLLSEGQHQQSQLTSQAQRQSDLMTTLQGVGERGFQDSQASGDAQRAAALAGADNNLQAALQQIGLGRAGAERQYQSDLASNGQSRANLALQAYQAQQAAQQKRLDSYNELVGQATVSGQENFIRNHLEKLNGTPQYDAFDQLISEGGSKPGVEGLTKAMHALNSPFKDANGNTDPNKTFAQGLADGTALGVKVNPAEIEALLRQYYDDSTSVNDDLLRKLLSQSGMDAAFLGL